ncbi:MAG: hypothetical protein HZA19_05025, partial [Nitrospirae bacterium]|nr:hypothetical protein [Nitrospirota bacterium]
GGGILVNVPSPARFAFHKVIVAQERGASLHAKRAKNLFQAAQLFSVLAEERPGDLLLAWEELQRRGEGWVRRVVSGFSALRKSHPDAGDKVHKVVPGL